jgi:DNA-binding response OmpR family regulator
MKALLAEADPRMRADLAAVVGAAGHDVTVVADGVAAIEAYGREQPSFVIVADDLPHASGIDVCRHVRAHPSGDGQTFILVVVSDEAHDRLALLLDAGADDFILTDSHVSGLPARLAARTTIAERRIATDAARRRAEAALAEAQRLAGIGEMAMALQHQINNPLAALLGHAALIEQELYDPGEERALLAVIVEQAHRIADVVKRLSALRYPTSAEFVRGGDAWLDLPEDAAE